MVKNSLIKLKVSKRDSDHPKAAKAEIEGLVKAIKPVDVEVPQPIEVKMKATDQSPLKPSAEEKPTVKKTLIKRLREENKFITDLLDLMVFPRQQYDESDSDDLDDVPDGPSVRGNFGESSRASSFGELHDRLHRKLSELKGSSRKDPGHKKQGKLTKAERRLKAKQEKRLQSKLMKTSAVIKPSDFGSKMALAAQKVGAKPAKPVFNANGKMVFSKFDFTDESGLKTPTKSASLDPKAALQRLQKHKEKLKTLEAEGKSEKAQVIEETTAWKTALDRSTGLKVKDDPTLLKKSIKRLDRKKKSSKKKWETRLENEEKRKSFQQVKRAENLAKRKSEKKIGSKKSRSVPGFR